MIRLNIHEAKTHLSRYLAMIEGKEETILLCRRNVPIAEIRALPARRKVAPLGLWRQSIEIPDSFFAPLPEEVIVAFEGRERVE